MSQIYVQTGFSIELEGNILTRRGDYEGKPLYESYGGTITAIALVKSPAIDVGLIMDEETRQVTGPVMIPDIKIPRNEGPYGPEDCYWYFTAKTIEKLKKAFKGSIKVGH